jgi:prepilin-type N-terminal cleavage/methylation domain-containing protein
MIHTSSRTIYRNSIGYVSGFTLIEIIIVIAILSILATVGMEVLPKVRHNADLNSVAEGVVSLLAEARAKTTSSEDGSQFGVYVQADRAVLFKGTTYATGTPENREFIFPKTAELSLFSFSGGGNQIIFKRLTGDTSEHGSLMFRNLSDITKTRRVTVISSGVAVLDPPAILPSANLAAYWRLDEGSGTIVSDSSGNNNNGTLVNMETPDDWVSGFIGNALLFDGNKEYITVPNSSSLDIGGELTISLWLKPSVDSSNFHNSWNFFIYHRNSLKYETGFYNTGGPRFKPYNESGDNFDFSPSLSWSAGTWYNVIYKRQGALLEIYVDGILEDSRNDFTGNLRTGGTEVRIGGAGSSNSGFIGTIDEVAIWNRALTASEISQIQDMH